MLVGVNMHKAQICIKHEKLLKTEKSGGCRPTTGGGGS